MNRRLVIAVTQNDMAVYGSAALQNKLIVTGAHVDIADDAAGPGNAERIRALTRPHVAQNRPCIIKGNRPGGMSSCESDLVPRINGAVVLHRGDVRHVDRYSSTAIGGRFHHTEVMKLDTVRRSAVTKPNTRGVVGGRVHVAVVCHVCDRTVDNESLGDTGAATSRGRYVPAHRHRASRAVHTDTTRVRSRLVCHGVDIQRDGFITPNSNGSRLSPGPSGHLSLRHGEVVVPAECRAVSVRVSFFGNGVDRVNLDFRSVARI